MTLLRAIYITSLAWLFVRCLVAQENSGFKEPELRRRVVVLVGAGIGICFYMGTFAVTVTLVKGGRHAVYPCLFLTPRCYWGR